MIAASCQQYTAAIFKIFHKEEKLQKVFNRTQSIKHEEALIIKFNNYDHRIDSLIYHQERCDDRLFFYPLK